MNNRKPGIRFPSDSGLSLSAGCKIYTKLGIAEPQRLFQQASKSVPFGFHRPISLIFYLYLLASRSVYQRRGNRSAPVQKIKLILSAVIGRTRNELLGKRRELRKLVVDLLNLALIIKALFMFSVDFHVKL